MTRASLGVRSLGVVLSLALASLAVQPQFTSAAVPLNIAKTVQDLSPNAPAGSTSPMQDINANAGDLLQYNLSYTVPAGTNGVTITDSLTGGQTLVNGSCATNYGTCAISGNTVTITIGNVTTDIANGIASFRAQINSSSSNYAALNYTGGYINSNATYVTVAATPGTALNVTKSVVDVNNGHSGTSVGASPGDELQYNITVTNPGSVSVGAVTLSDTIQSGLQFGHGCTPADCTFPNPSTIQFNLGTLGAGQSASASFYAMIPGTWTAQTITNVATATSTSGAQGASNTTIVVVNVTPPPCGSCGNPCTTCTTQCGWCGGCTSSCGNPCGPCTNPCNGYYSGYCTVYPYYPYTCAGYPYNPPYLAYCGTPTFSATSTYTGVSTICGEVTAYTPASTTPGSLTINGETLTLMPLLVVTGQLTAPGAYCITFTVNSAGQLSAVTVNGNVGGVNYVCGGVSNYNNLPSYAYTPYQGWNGWSGSNQWGPQPVQNGSYSWNGPIMVGGYPFQVSSGAYFPYSPQFGNPYCFLMNPTGSVTSTLSEVPTAAFTQEANPVSVRQGNQHAG